MYHSFRIGKGLSVAIDNNIIYNNIIDNTIIDKVF